VAMDVGQNGKASYNWKFNSLSFDPRVNDFGNNRIRGGKGRYQDMKVGAF
jgi:hypothetical protein